MNKDDLDWLCRIAKEWIGAREDIPPSDARAVRDLIKRARDLTAGQPRDWVLLLRDPDTAQGIHPDDVARLRERLEGQIAELKKRIPLEICSVCKTEADPACPDPDNPDLVRCEPCVEVAALKARVEELEGDVEKWRSRNDEPDFTDDDREWLASRPGKEALLADYQRGAQSSIAFMEEMTATLTTANAERDTLKAERDAALAGGSDEWLTERTGMYRRIEQLEAARDAALEDYAYLEGVVVAESKELVTAPEECPPDAVRELARLARDHRSEKENWVVALRNVESDLSAALARVEELEATLSTYANDNDAVYPGSTGILCWAHLCGYLGLCEKEDYSLEEVEAAISAIRASLSAALEERDQLKRFYDGSTDWRALAYERYKSLRRVEAALASMTEERDLLNARLATVPENVQFGEAFEKGCAAARALAQEQINTVESERDGAFAELRAMTEERDAAREHAQELRSRLVRQTNAALDPGGDVPDVTQRSPEEVNRIGIERKLRASLSAALEERDEARAKVGERITRATELKAALAAMTAERDAAQAELAEAVALLREEGYKPTGLEWRDRRDAFLAKHAPRPEGGE